jgi:hypothetical protein
LEALPSRRSTIDAAGIGRGQLCDLGARYRSTLLDDVSPRRHCIDAGPAETAMGCFFEAGGFTPTARGR